MLFYWTLVITKFLYHTYYHCLHRNILHNRFPHYLIIRRNVSWAANQQITVISKGSCDTEDWSNDAERNKLQFVYIIVAPSFASSIHFLFFIQWGVEFCTKTTFICARSTVCSFCEMAISLACIALWEERLPVPFSRSIKWNLVWRNNHQPEGNCEAVWKSQTEGLLQKQDSYSFVYILHLKIVDHQRCKVFE